MLLFAVIFGLFMLFQAPDSQISSYTQVLSRADALIKETGATTPDSGLTSILQNLQSLGIKSTAPLNSGLSSILQNLQSLGIKPTAPPS